MIERVAAKKFKGGVTFDQTLSKATWFVGPNGSGKSARAQALMIVVHGHVMGFNKTNAAVLDMFGDGDDMAVEITANGKRIGREMTRKGDGKISQKLLVGGRKVSKDAFVTALATAGNPSVFDIQAFWSLSDAKKIDEMFGAAGSDELTGITDKIAEANARLNKVRGDIRGKEKQKGDIEISLSQLDLPNIEIPELQAKMKDAEAEIEEVRKRIFDAEKAAAAAESAEREKAEADRRAQAEAERVAREKEATEKREAEAAKTREREEENRKRDQAVREKRIAEEATATARREAAAEAERVARELERLGEGEQGKRGAAAGTVARDYLVFVDKVLTTLEAAGCKSCAARVVANAELKRLKGGSR